jgi:hypothetical protein
MKIPITRVIAFGIEPSANIGLCFSSQPIRNFLLNLVPVIEPKPEEKIEINIQDRFGLQTGLRFSLRLYLSFSFLCF